MATMAQVDLGIYFAKKKYFDTWFVYSEPVYGVAIPYFLGGWGVGWLLLLNLCMAHATRFEWEVKKTGLWLTHVGLIVLIVGSGMTEFFANESQLVLKEGQEKNHLISSEQAELVVTKETLLSEKVVSIPEQLLSSGMTVTQASLPFSMRIVHYAPNTVLSMASLGKKPAYQATQGIGKQIWSREIAENKRDMAQNAKTAWVDICKGNRSLGVWMVSTQLGAMQPIWVDDCAYKIQLRPRRTYLPFSIKLLDFKHDVYPGTSIPKNFSSKVRVKNKQTNETLEALISMNNPLRYGGFTVYQASFSGNDTISVFQVVQNRFWALPYIASFLIFLGLLIHFSMHLMGHFGKRR